MQPFSVERYTSLVLWKYAKGGVDGLLTCRQVQGITTVLHGHDKLFLIYQYWRTYTPSIPGRISAQAVDLQEIKSPRVLACKVATLNLADGWYWLYRALDDSTVSFLESNCHI